MLKHSSQQSKPINLTMTLLVLCLLVSFFSTITARQFLSKRIFQNINNAKLRRPEADWLSFRDIEQQPHRQESPSISLALSASGCSSALVYEYLSPYTLTSDDLSKLISQNFSTIPPIAKFQFGNYTVSDVTGKTAYNGAGKKITPGTNGAVTVDIDTFNIQLTYNVTVKEFGLKKDITYTVKTNVSKIIISYSKSIDFTSQNVQITNFNRTTNPSDMINDISPSPTTPKDKDVLDAAIKGTSNSVYSNLLKTLDGIKQLLQQNAKIQSFSPTYKDPKYTYKFYNFSFPISMKSAQISKGDDANGILNCLEGQIDGSTVKRDSPPPTRQQNALQLFTVEFIQAFAQRSASTYPKWQPLTIDRTWIKSSVFQFRLIDLEYVLSDNVFVELGQYYSNEIKYRCKLNQLGNIALATTSQSFVVDAVWDCTGIVAINATTETQVMGKSIEAMGISLEIRQVYLIWALLPHFHTTNLPLDFSPSITYVLSPSILHSSTPTSTLAVSIDSLSLGSCVYRPSGPSNTYKVVNEKLANQYIQQTFSDMRLPTIGTYMDIAASVKGVIVGTDGVWVN